jgi:hypothetical protein
MSAYSMEQKPSAIASPTNPVLVISDPIASIVFNDNVSWLCIREVNALCIDGNSVDFIPHSTLLESTVSVSYQLLGLWPASSDDDPTGKYDWRSCRASEEHTFTVPGRVALLLNSKLSDMVAIASSAFYLLESQALVALSASLCKYMTLSDMKSIPKLTSMKDFPYRKITGKMMAFSIIMTSTLSNALYASPLLHLICLRNSASFNIWAPYNSQSQS